MFLFFFSDHNPDDNKWLIGIQDVNRVAVRVIRVDPGFDEEIFELFPLRPAFFTDATLIDGFEGYNGLCFSHNRNVRIETVLYGHHYRNISRL